MADDIDNARQADPMPSSGKKTQSKRERECHGKVEVD